MGVTKSFLKAWSIFTLLWVIAASIQNYHHYALLLTQSNFIYNPMIKPDGLLADNPENREILKRSFFQGWRNLYSFGMPGTVEVTFSEEYFRDGYLETWMPNGSSLISVSVRSAEWSSFRQKLINEALRLRETQTANIYRQYFAKDMLPIFGVPAAFIFGFATSRTMKHFFREIE